MAVYDPPLDSHSSSSHASLVSTAEFQGRHGGCCVVASPFRQQQQKHPRHTSVLLALCLCKRPKQSTSFNPSHSAGPAAAASPTSSAPGLPDLATASFSDLASAHGIPEPSDASFSELAASARLPPQQQQQQQQQQERPDHQQQPQLGSAASLGQFAPRLHAPQQQPQRQSQQGHVAPALRQVSPRRRHSAAQQAVLHAIYESTAEYDRWDNAARANSSSGGDSGRLQSSSDPCNTRSSNSSSDGSSSEGSADAPSSSIYELLFGQAGASAAAAAVAARRATLNSSNNSINELRPLLSQSSAAGIKSAMPRSGSSTDNSVSSADPAGSAQRSFSPLLRFTINPLYNSSAVHSSISSRRVLPSPSGPASPLPPPPPAAATAAAHAPHTHSSVGSPNSQLLAMQLLSEVCRASTVFRAQPSVVTGVSGAGNGSTVSQAGSDTHGLRSSGSNGGNSGEGGRVDMLARGHAQHMLAPHSEPSGGGDSGSSGNGGIAAGVADPEFLQHLLTALGLLGQQQQQQVAGVDFVVGAFSSSQQQQEQQQQWYQYLAEISRYGASSSSHHSSTYYTCQTTWSSGKYQDNVHQPAADQACGAATGTAAAAAAVAAQTSHQQRLQEDSPYSSVCMPRQASTASLGWATSGDNVLLGSPTISPVRARVQAAPAAAAAPVVAVPGVAAAVPAAAPGPGPAVTGAAFGQPVGLASVLNTILATAASQSGTPLAAAAAGQVPSWHQQQQHQQQRLSALGTLDSQLYATNSSCSSSSPAVMLSDLIAAVCGGCGSNAGSSRHGSNGGSNGSSSPDLVRLLGEGEQLSAMSMGELRELLGRAAALSLAQLQRQQQQQRVAV